MIKYHISNFRKFDNSGCTIAFSPITFFTGCNSSGKSSISKSFVLLSKMFHNKELYIDLLNQDLNVGCYSNILNNKAKAGTPIEFSYSIFSALLGQTIYVSYFFEGDIHKRFESRLYLKSFTINWKKNVPLISGEVINGKVQYQILDTSLRELFVKFEYDGVVEYNRDYKNLSKDEFWSDMFFFSVWICHIFRYSSTKAEIRELLKYEITENHTKANNPAYLYFSLGTKRESIDKLLSSGISLIKKHDLLDSESSKEDFRLGLILISTALSYNESEIESFVEFCKFIERQQIHYLGDLDDGRWRLENDKICTELVNEVFRTEGSALDVILEYSRKIPSCLFIYGIQEFYNQILLKEHFEGDSDSIDYFVPIEKCFHEYVDLFVREVLFQENKDSKERAGAIKNCFPHRQDDYVSFRNVYYIGATDVVVKRLYTESSDSMLSWLINNVEDYPFTNKWLWKLGVGNHLERKNAEEGVGFFVYVVSQRGKSKKEQLLADLGYGISHLVVNLLLIDYYRSHSSDKENATLILEEPETHLHPSLQSKLADIYYDAYKQYGLHFIIETHSEYMLRKSQVIVSKLNFQTNKEADENSPFRAYYFPSKGRPYSLGYRKDGCFVNSFGKGFYDESSSLTYELL